MRTTITIDSRLIALLQQASGAKSKAKAVMIAIQEYLRRCQIEKITTLKGRIRFEMTAGEIRHAQR